MGANRPDSGDVHVNGLLTNISVAYRNDEYFADRIFPIVSVAKQSDIIPSYNKGDFLRNEVQERAPATEAAEAGWQVTTTATYFAKGYALKKAIPDEIRANADAPFDMDRDATMFLTEKALIHRERLLSTTINSTSVWTTSTSVGVKWSDYANSDPLSDITTGNRTVQQLIGRRCNTLVMGQIVWDRLKLHPDFMEMVKYTTTMSIPTEQQLAKALGIDNLFVITAIYESAAEGATSSIAPCWDDDALLLYVPKSASIMTPAAGYQFVWKPSVGGGAQYMRSYRSEAKSTDYIEVRSYFDIKVTTADAGVIWADCCD